MRGLWVATALLLLALAMPSATAQAPWVYQGGEPGIVRIDVAGIDVTSATGPSSAIRVDPSDPVDLTITISPPENTTWQVRSVTVGLLVNGPGSTPPDALMRNNPAFADLPPGFTVVLNRTIELGALKRAGAGTFLMQAEVLDAEGAQLYSQSFYVRVAPGPAALLTVQGATITAVSVATGYGFWQIAKDTKELRDAWDRHRKKKARAKLDVIGAAEHAVEEVGVKVGHGVDKMVALHRDVQGSEKQLGLVRWSATGLGLGGVTMAWLQFLGYLAFDAAGFLITALEGAAISSRSPSSRTRSCDAHAPSAMPRPTLQSRSRPRPRERRHARWCQPTRRRAPPRWKSGMKKGLCRHPRLFNPWTKEVKRHPAGSGSSEAILCTARPYLPSHSPSWRPAA